MIRVFKFLTEATQVRYFELYPAAVYMWTNGIEISPSIVETMQSIAPIAIGDIELTSSYGIAFPFSFDGEGGIPFTEGLGFSEYNYTEVGNPVGGQMIELIP